MENSASIASSDPSSFLSEIIGAPVKVKLNSSVEYRGRYLFLAIVRLNTEMIGFLGYLVSVDGYMNISLEKTEEYVNGKLRRSYGEAFVRGNNGIFMFHSN